MGTMMSRRYSSYCAVCAAQRARLLRSTRPTKEYHLHRGCMNAVRAHNRCIEKAPAHVKSQVIHDFENNKTAWKARVLPWISPEAKARDSARNVTAQQFKSGTEHSNHTDTSAIEDILKVICIEYMAFEGFWHLKSHEASKADFEQIHLAQKGKYDVKDLNDNATEKKIGIKDVGRERSQKGDSTRSYAKHEHDEDEEGFEMKRRRLVSKSPRSLLMAPCVSKTPAAHVPSTSAYSVAHFLAKGDIAGSEVLDASTLSFGEWSGLGRWRFVKVW